MLRIFEPQTIRDLAADEVDYELTPKDQPEKGSVVFRKSIAAFEGSV